MPSYISVALYPSGSNKRCSMLLRVSIPVETGNAAAKAGTLGPTVDQIVADLKPEAEYSFADDGQRSCSIVFDMKDTSQIPSIAEPWFLVFNAKVSLRPVMNARRVVFVMKGGVVYKNVARGAIPAYAGVKP